MRITEIEVSFGLTENLGDYANCRPEVRVKAQLEEGDDYEASVAVLADQARTKVHAEADAMLMKHGQAPRYYEGLRYTARAFVAHKTVVLYPSHLSVDGLVYSYIVKHRYPCGVVVEAANKEAEAKGCLVIRCESQAGMDAIIEDFVANERAQREAERVARDTEQAQAEHHIDDDGCVAMIHAPVAISTITPIDYSSNNKRRTPR